MPERLRLAVHLGAWCALRYGEVAELRRSDIDVKNGSIHVRRGVTWVSAKRIVGLPKAAAGVHLSSTTFYASWRRPLNKPGALIVGSTICGTPGRR